MNKQSEIDELINELKIKCPNIVVLQLTNFGEKPFESGIWKFYLENNEENYINIEVQHGDCYAVYSSRQFTDKYPVTASKICDYFSQFIEGN